MQLGSPALVHWTQGIGNPCTLDSLQTNQSPFWGRAQASMGLCERKTMNWAEGGSNQDVK